MTSTAAALERLVERAEALMARVEAVLPQPLGEPNWAASVAFRYRKRGGPLGGLGLLDPVRHVGRIRYEDLQEVDSQKERFARNLAQFVAGRPANNVLLSGARGTGKSSLVKALLNAYAKEGLRLIEVERQDLVDLPDIVDLIADRPGRYLKRRFSPPGSAFLIASPIFCFASDFTFSFAEPVRFESATRAKCSGSSV